MLQARMYQMTVRLAEGRVLIMGGIVPFTGKCPVMVCVIPDTASVEVYDPRSGKFSGAGSLGESSHGASALLLHDGRVLVYVPNDVDYAMVSLETYDPATKTSAEIKPPNGLKLPSDAAVVELADGRVLIAGGTYDNDFSTSNVTLIFDPASGGFSKGPLMAEPRERATASLLRDGSVLIVGGDYYQEYTGEVTKSAEVINPLNPLSKSTLVSTSDSGLGYTATSTQLTDGRVLVTGGGAYDAKTDLNIPATPEVFDPGTGRFALTGPMVTPRGYSTAVALPDGRALVFGGVDAKGAAVGTIEAFDPDSDTFRVVAKGFPNIIDFTATLLGNGQILIAGGWNGKGFYNPTAATWLLKP